MTFITPLVVTPQVASRQRASRFSMTQRPARTSSPLRRCGGCTATPVITFCPFICPAEICPSHLRQIGTAMHIYAFDNKGQYPRTNYDRGGSVTFFTGFYETDPFLGAMSPNDVTAATFLMVRGRLLNLKLFVSPSSTQQVDN